VVLEFVAGVPIGAAGGVAIGGVAIGFAGDAGAATGFAGAAGVADCV
jgi:hypothetical protein